MVQKYIIAQSIFLFITYSVTVAQYATWSWTKSDGTPNASPYGSNATSLNRVGGIIAGVPPGFSSKKWSIPSSKSQYIEFSINAISPYTLSFHSSCDSINYKLRRSCKGKDTLHVEYSADGGAWTILSDDIVSNSSFVQFKHFFSTSINVTKQITFRIFQKGVQSSVCELAVTDIVITGSIYCYCLPIRLSSFTGVVKENNILLEWVAATEINNKKFVLEKSTDGILFNTLAEVPGAGNSFEQKHYSASDENPSETNYYRLTQVDMDGQEHRFQTIEVHYAARKEKDDRIVLFPNPATDDKVIISGLSDFGEAITLDMYSVSGSLVMHSQVYAKKDETPFVLPDNINEGLYFLSIKSGQNNFIKKFIVQ